MSIKRISIIGLALSLLGILSLGFTCFGPRTQYVLGLEAQRYGDFKEAIEYYSNALDKRDLSAELKANIYLQRSKAYLFNRQYPLAFSDSRKSIDLQPDWANGYLQHSDIHLYIGEFDKARLGYDKLISSYPDFLPAYINRGIVFYYLNEFDNAEKDFKSTSRVSSIDVCLELWIYLTTQQMGRDGKNRLKNRSQALDLKKWPGPLVALQLGKLRPAEVIQKSPEMDGTSERESQCSSYFHVAQYYLLLGENIKATELFRKVHRTGATKIIEHAAAKIELDRLLH